VQEPIIIHDFPDAGVSLMPSTARQFDERMAALIPAWSGIAAAVKPCLVILSNHSERTIVAYCVWFEMTDGAGRLQQSFVHFNYPNAITGGSAGRNGLPRDREVRPGEERVVGTMFEIMPDVNNQWLTDFAKQQGERLKDVRRLEVRIDAMIFDDGSLVGEDTSELQRAFETYLTATQEVCQSVVSSIDGGSSIDDVFQWLLTALADAKTRVEGGDRSALYYVEATADALRARRKVGDERVADVLRQAIRHTPFVIRRDSLM
jgi:hypothetical protein